MVWGIVRRGPMGLLIVGMVFLVLGLTGLAAAAAFAVNETRSGRTASAIGTVAVAAVPRPVIQFMTPNGEVIRFTNIARSSFWKDGDAVDVAYDPATPTNAVVDGLVGRWFPTALAVALGLPFLLIGLVLRGRARRQLRAGAAGSRRPPRR
ncbi:DUF3592 domain-containing protein [Labrys wisconsinensis]|uniref:DUF3592 domain-containing protein n=1 Tax=Labrys wisconsinensis TaxID=425677 RepID=A0ABU0JBB7_9HYPH|nr:DUF3592 domain-containing protein [Labrys wisconsinensis]MDQ0471563.1 hypothetical protein [Labrys wisconsinensis]